MVSKTKEKLSKAFKTVVCKKSFAKATIADITGECGMTRENFYYHFHDKYDILKWTCENEVIAYIPEKADKVTAERFIVFFIRKINKDYKFYRTIVKDMGTSQVQKEAFPYVRGILCNLIKDTIDDAVWKMREEKEDFAVGFFADAFITYFINYLTSHEKMDENVMLVDFHFLFAQFF